jgi:5-(carboxyamino)imidazole ribonucleotide synthase
MGYRIWILDPDPDCPAAPVADRVVVGSYEDVDAALELADGADVVTYELEHVAAGVVEAVAARRPVRPGLHPLTVTQDRLAERRFVEAAGAAVAPWRTVQTPGDVLLAAAELDLPLRLKIPVGGYDGRNQLRIAGPADLDDAWARLGQVPGVPLLAEREVPFAAELSIVVARDLDGRVVPFPVARNVHDHGILTETVAPAPVSHEVADRATGIGIGLAEAMDLCGILTVELFLLDDSSLLVNELAPRVHNSGHWTIDGAATSQFEQHVRAICGLGLGDPQALSPAAMVNLLGDGARRPARLVGAPAALADPAIHLHLYGKREVFDRRKMGHATALAATVDEATTRARAAVGALAFATEPEGEVAVSSPATTVPG